MMRSSSKIETFKEGGGREAFSHFHFHYGHKALRYFSKSVKVNYDSTQPAYLPANCLGTCTYFGKFEEVNLRDKSWNGGRNERKAVTVTHELTHALYSQISGSQAWNNSLGQKTYQPERAINEGIAVLGANLSEFAPHCAEYMQYACRTIAALETLAAEEGTTPMALYKSLSNVSDLPLEQRKDFKVRLDTLYRTKLVIKNYTGTEIVNNLKKWRKSA